MSNNSVVSNLGIVTAYRSAQAGGYTGTYEEFVTLLASIETVEQDIRAEFEDILETLSTLDDKVERADAIATQISSYVTRAETAATTAEAESDEAASSASAAQTSMRNAASSEAEAAASATQADNTVRSFEADVQSYMDTVETARSSIADSVADAANAATNAAGSESRISVKETTINRIAGEVTTSEQNASQSADDAADSALLAESYAHGNTGARADEAEDNAKYYMEETQSILEDASQILDSKIGAMSLTKAQYDALDPEVQESNTMFLITDGTKKYVLYHDQVFGAGNAAGLPYSNTDSGLDATDVNGAIDEVNSDLNDVVDGMTNYVSKNDLAGRDIIQAGTKAADAVQLNSSVQGTFAYDVANALKNQRAGAYHGVAFNFGIDDQGNYGYIKAGADSVTPFRNPTGNAVASDVLSGKTFSNASGDNIQGTMTAKTSPTIATTAASGTAEIAVTPGYYNKISVNQANAYNAGKNAATNVTVCTNKSFTIGDNASNTLGTVNLTGCKYVIARFTIKGTTHAYDWFYFTVGTKTTMFQARGGSSDESTNVDKPTDSSPRYYNLFVPVTGTTNMAVKLKKVCYTGTSGASSVVCNYCYGVK